jgi:hypothetical protein
MKFINKTNNSVYLEDVLISIPYKNEEIQEIETETVKKSFAFQQMVDYVYYAMSQSLCLAC